MLHADLTRVICFMNCCIFSCRSRHAGQPRLSVLWQDFFSSKELFAICVVSSTGTEARDSWLPRSRESCPVLWGKRSRFIRGHLNIWPKSKAFGSDDDCLCVLKTSQETVPIVCELRTIALPVTHSVSHLTFIPCLVYAFVYLPYGLLVFGFSLHV